MNEETRTATITFHNLCRFSRTPLAKNIQLFKTFARQHQCTLEVYDTYVTLKAASTAQAEDMASHFMDAYCD